MKKYKHSAIIKIVDNIKGIIFTTDWLVRELGYYRLNNVKINHNIIVIERGTVWTDTCHCDLENYLLYKQKCIRNFSICKNNNIEHIKYIAALNDTDDKHQLFKITDSDNKEFSYVSFPNGEIDRDVMMNGHKMTVGEINQLYSSSDIKCLVPDTHKRPIKTKIGVHFNFGDAYNESDYNEELYINGKPSDIYINDVKYDEPYAFLRKDVIDLCHQLLYYSSSNCRDEDDDMMHIDAKASKILDLLEQ